MYSLVLFSSLAILAPAFAAPNVQYLTPQPTAASAATSVSITPPEPTSLPGLDDLRKRGKATRALEARGKLEKRQDTCPVAGYYSCGDGWCCQTGALCVSGGLCYDPAGDTTG